MLFYFSERGHPGPQSFSFSRRLYRKKPDKLRRMQQKQAGVIQGNRNAESSGPIPLNLGVVNLENRNPACSAELFQKTPHFVFSSKPSAAT
jgi:hypothetical protein